MVGAHARLAEPALRERFGKDGFVSIAEFLDATEVGDLRGEVDRVVREVVPGMPSEAVYLEDVGKAASLKQLQQLHVHDAALGRWLLAGPFERLAALLLQDTPVPQNLQYFDKAPGINRPTPPHQDGAYFPIEPQNAVTIWLALEDVGLEQGCVRYVRGSHRHGLRQHERGDTLGFSREIVDFGPEDRALEEVFPCAAGHVIAHHALTIHRAAGNTSADRHRRALGFIYYGAACRTDTAARDAYQAQLDLDLRAAGRIDPSEP